MWPCDMLILFGHTGFQMHCGWFQNGGTHIEMEKVNKCIRALSSTKTWPSCSSNKGFDGYFWRRKRRHRRWTPCVQYRYVCLLLFGNKNGDHHLLTVKLFHYDNIVIAYTFVDRGMSLFSSSSVTHTFCWTLYYVFIVWNGVSFANFTAANSRWRLPVITIELMIVWQSGVFEIM